MTTSSATTNVTLTCPHGNLYGMCQQCMLRSTYPTITTTTGTSTATIPWTPVDHFAPAMKERILVLEKELAEQTKTLHDALAKEVEWQERIDTLTGERDTLRKLAEEAISDLERLTRLVRAALEGDAEWVPSPKN